MGNITRMSLKHTLTDDGVTEALKEINARRFGSYFRITTDQGGWEFHAPGMMFRGQEITYPVWAFYRDSPRRIGGKGPRPNPMWASWAWWQFLTEMTLRFGGVITDEGISESIDPKDYANESFAGYLARWRNNAYSEHERNRIDAIKAQESDEHRFEIVPEGFLEVAFPPEAVS